MDFSSIKLGFLQYLKELNQGNNGNYNTESPELSVFLYSDEFKQYLQQNNIADESIFSKDLSENISLDLSNGNLVDNSPEEGNNIFVDAINDALTSDTLVKSLNTNSNETLDNNEILDFLNSLENDNGEVTFDSAAQTIQNNTLTGGLNPGVLNVLNDIYSNEDAKKLIDLDGDGQINAEEKQQFENFVQGANEELTAEDLQKALQDIQDGTFEYTPQSTEKPGETPETPTEVPTTEDTDEAEKTKKKHKTHSSDDSGNNNSTDTDNGDKNTNTQETKDISNMSLSELESAKKDQQTEVDKAQDEINNIYNGSNADVAKAQEGYNTAKENYEEALKNDKSISQELKDEQTQNLKDIEDKKAEIDELKIDKNNTENDIRDKESEISSDESEISALKSALSDLKNYDANGDPAKQAEINQKIAEIEAKIAAKEEEKSTHESELRSLQTHLSDVEGQITTKEGELKPLEERRTEIEEEIMDSECSQETKDALAELQKYEAGGELSVDSAKEKALEAAQKTLDDAQEELDKINDAINTKKADETKKEYSFNDLDHPEKLYESMGLEEKGMDYETFKFLVDGYKQLEDKGNGILCAFVPNKDTSKTDGQYYQIDMNNFEVVGQWRMVRSAKDMSNVAGANISGSNTTASGWFQIGEQYYSKKMGKNAIRMLGLEKGINDNTASRGQVFHTTNGSSTHGCLGLPKGTFDDVQQLAKQGALLCIVPINDSAMDKYIDLSTYYA